MGNRNRRLLFGPPGDHRKSETGGVVFHPLAWNNERQEAGMRVLAVVGSMRKGRNSDSLTQCVIEEMKSLDPGLSAEIVRAADLTVQACRVVCSDFCISHPYQCSIEDDAAGLLDRMISADAILLAAPLYFRVPPSRFHTLIERLQSIFFFQESQGKDEAVSPLAGKPCGLIGVAEYSNPHQVLEYLHDFCTLLKMRPVVLDQFPYLGVAGRDPIEKDTVFHPYERSRDLAAALTAAVKVRKSMAG
jgi:multimeric flavodoxin WrbA